ncbi:hypothetical protein [Pantoea vagans]|uniref:hypothetical protein n=1 Tax=Pantoea vagans TaxID=470934 RepID=UPI003B026DDC
MDFSVPKIKGIAQNLSLINDKSGVFYFELDKEVDVRWENLFSGYISLYKPPIFSLFSPTIIGSRFIRVHADLDGVMGIENVLLHLQAMISFANSHWVKMTRQPKANELLSARESDGANQINNRLSGLYFQ